MIPRGDTEVLVEEALKCLRDGASALDICTGSGAIAIVLALKSGAAVTASDVSDDALALAAENILKTGAQVALVKSDLFESVEGTFDLITANPPYIPSAEIEKLDEFVKREPRLALDGGEDGLDYYRRIAAEAPAHLKAGGVLLMEIGYDQAEAVKSLFASLGEITVIRDLDGHDRVVEVRKNA